MKILLIFICILICVIVWKKQIDYENYKNEPYITVVSQAGLNNRIQVILSYLYKANQEGKKLKVIWINDKQCPDRFDNLFEPINNVEIIYNFNLLDSTSYDYKNWNKENNDYINANYYSLLKPLEPLQYEIDNKIQLLNNNYIACHIRRTDALTHNWYKHHVKNDDEYVNFINNFSSDLKIYIATDCKKTQQKFIDLYPNRIIYKKIEDSNNFRQTSLQDAVIDIYVCANASYFMRSYGSFSDTIIELRKLNNLETYENVNLTL